MGSHMSKKPGEIVKFGLEKPGEIWATGYSRGIGVVFRRILWIGI